MKKNLKISSFLIILMVFSSVVSAQTEKGTAIFSGSTNLTFSSITPKMEDGNNSMEGNKASNFEFTPGAGIFIANNLALGVQVSINSATERLNREDYTESSTMFLPFALLYFGSGDIKPFVQAALGMGTQKLKYDNEKERANIFGYELGGGLAVFLNQHVSLDFSLNYASATSKFDVDYNNTELKLKSRGIGGNIGFSIFF